MRLISAVLVVGLLAAASLGVCASAADGAHMSHEHQLKAAYVFNFVKFVEWPASPVGAPLTVCFVGAEGVHNAFASGIEKKRAGGHPLKARNLQADEPLDNCHAVYVHAPVVSANPTLVGRHSARPLLTVSDAPGFTRLGGMIEMFTENNRLRFNINVTHAEHAGLRISSSVLKLAAAVERDRAR